MDLLRTLLSWLLAAFIIFVFVQAAIHPLPNPPLGQVKLYDLPGQNIVFQTMADRSGMAVFEPSVRVLTALAELVAAFFLLLPWTRRFGAMLAAMIMVGAVGFHLSPWLGREIPVSLEAGAPTDGGQLFMLAVAMLVASLLLIFVHPQPKRKRPF
ncbi:MAG: hypothetical protein AAF253_12510 [Pseudomonadota bacterium]